MITLKRVDQNFIGAFQLLNKIKNFILFSDIKNIKNLLKKNKIYARVNIIEKNKGKFVKNKFNIFTYKSVSLEDNTYKSLKYAYSFCKEKLCIGIITLPLRKDLIIKKVNKYFIGQTEYFQKLNRKTVKKIF